VYIYTGAPHASQSNEKDHAIIRLKTAEQVEKRTHQVAHVYLDEKYEYVSHKLWELVKKDDQSKKKKE
jgi:hypothetical protein